MPYVEKSSYHSRPFYMINPHWETIIPSLFSKGPELNYKRRRMELVDGDFLDVDYLDAESKKCIIITHGLEGDSNRYYVKRTADYFHKRGWNIIAWNCRSCSGEMNRLPRFYHHGATEDLGFIVDSAINQSYESIVLFGYSMGGSMSLKYAGERELDKSIKAVVAFSVPCNLRDSAIVLKQKENRIYEDRFLKKLIRKMRVKSTHYPNELKKEVIDSILDFDDFHEKITAPLHGFEDVDDFFASATCDKYLPAIKIPAFIGNALNDPMLGEKCYPIEIAKKSEKVFLETPAVGGHVGFSIFGKKHSWMELRASQFISDNADI